MCAAHCARDHLPQCTQASLQSPNFGEKFAGPRYPLTKAVALKGVTAQAPCDYKIDRPLGFLYGEGEGQNDLLWGHWAPDCKTL